MSHFPPQVRRHLAWSQQRRR